MNSLKELPVRRIANEPINRIMRSTFYEVSQPFLREGKGTQLKTDLIAVCCADGMIRKDAARIIEMIILHLVGYFQPRCDDDWLTWVEKLNSLKYLFRGDKSKEALKEVRKISSQLSFIFACYPVLCHDRILAVWRLKYSRYLPPNFRRHSSSISKCASVLVKELSGMIFDIVQYNGGKNHVEKIDPEVLHYLGVSSDGGQNSQTGCVSPECHCVDEEAVSKRRVKFAIVDA